MRHVLCELGGNGGLQVYCAPQQSGSQIVIGVFYSNECIIKTKHDGTEFDYYKFSTAIRLRGSLGRDGG